jgi:hypothetical protein
MDLDTAATRLCHLAALTVHHLAAGVVSLRHLLIHDARHHRCCCDEQKQDGNETGGTTQHRQIIELSDTGCMIAKTVIAPPYHPAGHSLGRGSLLPAGCSSA